MNIDYSKAPAWAVEVFYRKGDSGYYFGDNTRYQHCTGTSHKHGTDTLKIISDTNAWVRIPFNLENI